MRMHFSTHQKLTCLLLLTVILIFCINTPNLFQNVRRALGIPYDYKPSDTNKPSDQLIKLYKAQVKSRKMFMAVTDDVRDQSWGRLYNNLAPEVLCPEKAKVGITDEGGKWVCSPFSLPDNCVILALGMNGQTTFEEQIQRLTLKRCNAFAVDEESQPASILKRMNLLGIKTSVAKITTRTNGNYSEYTIQDLLKKFKIDKVEILKLDLEGMEVAVLDSFLKSNKVGQLLVETHSSPRQTLQLLMKIASRGYYLFHHEINGITHQYCEYSFIHEEALERYGAHLLARYLE